MPDSSSETIVKYLVVLFACLWGGVEVFRQAGQRTQGRDTRDDRGSLALLYACITLGYSIAIPVSFSRYGRLDWGRPYWLVCGVLLIGAGLWIRRSAVRTLGPFFTCEVGVEAHQPLVDAGLYRRIRHPGYLGQLLVFLGIGLALVNWISVVSLFLPVLVAFSRRMAVEEKLLQKHFGAQYDGYRARTRRLIPGIY